MQQVSDNIIVLFVLGTAGMLLLACSLVIFFVRSQNRMLRQQQQAQQTELAHQKALMGAVVASQEAERRRIGQDLHDDIGAALSVLRLSLDFYQPPAADAGSYETFSNGCKQRVDEIMHELRHIAHHLSPSLLTLHGLEAAVNKQLEIINLNGSIEATLANQAPELTGALNLEHATALYRVLEELINNTIKHAQATQITVVMNRQSGGELGIHYQDNGVGFSTTDAAKGIGLQNIESRLSLIGAQYELQTQPGAGFAIHITCPLNVTPHE